MDGVGLLLIQISVLFLLIPIYAVLFFIVYKIYTYEHLITNTEDFKNIKRFISHINAPKKERTHDLSEFTELAVLIAKSAGGKLFKMISGESAEKQCNKKPTNLTNVTNLTNQTTKVDEIIEKLCSFVCGVVFDNETYF